MEKGLATKFCEWELCLSRRSKCWMFDFSVNTAIVGVMVFALLTSQSLLRSSLTCVEGLVRCAGDLEEKAGRGRDGMERWMD